jgi:hypothetical protein
LELDDSAIQSVDDLSGAWQVAVHYHEIVKKFPGQRAKFRAIAADAVLDEAKNILGTLAKPYREVVLSEHEVGDRKNLTQVDFDFDETLDQGTKENWYTAREKIESSLVLCVDTSLSMTGEKLALTAVALAVVLLQFSSDPLSIVAFESEAIVLKTADQFVKIDHLIEKFLDVPDHGYTHLEAGLKLALKIGTMQHEKSGSLNVATVYLADKIQGLSVLKIGDDEASRDLLFEMVRRGHGVLREVKQIEELPRAMYGLVKDLIRGNLRPYERRL